MEHSYVEAMWCSESTWCVSRPMLLSRLLNRLKECDLVGRQQRGVKRTASSYYEKRALSPRLVSASTWMPSSTVRFVKLSLRFAQQVQLLYCQIIVKLFKWFIKQASS